MPERARKEKGKGPLTVLLLLAGLLFGSAGAAAERIGAEGPLSRIGQSRDAKATATLRTVQRSAAAEDDRDDSSALPPRTLSVTEKLGSRRTAVGEAAQTVAAPRAHPFSYRARAPPAA